MIKSVIFDLGGVLVPEGAEKIREGVAEYLNVSSFDLIERTNDLLPVLNLGGISLRDYYKNVLERFDINSKSPDEVLEKHLELYEKFSSKVDSHIPGLIGRIKNNGYVVASMTNTELEIYQRSQKHGYFKIFDKNFVSIEIGCYKPQYQFLGKILDELKCAPREVAAVEDTIKNVQVFCNMGINGILYEYKNITKLEIALRHLGVKID